MSSRGPVTELKAVAFSFMVIDGCAAVAHHACQFTGIDRRIVI
jgi:hypothetical protein